MSSNVNLDALIQREDFEITQLDTKSQPSSSGGQVALTVRVEELKKTAFFFSALRKPDFQRETNEWSPEKIISLIESYISGDLIPAVILWQNGGYTFVIDGSHRLSALAAWINDDYGDGPITKEFYDGVIPDDQKLIAERTRTSVRKTIGPYSDYLLAITNPEKVDQLKIKRALDLGRLAITLQWVNGDAIKAEDSFFKINQQATPINKTETILLKLRDKPFCMAARAIIRSGTGHKYWAKFPVETQEIIEQTAKEINDIFFVPQFKKPIKSLDLPIAGKLYSSQTLPLILNFVCLCNEIPDSDIENILENKNQKSNNEDKFTDIDGTITLQYLKTCKQIALRINSNDNGSLGLHPAIYLYSKDGRYKIASFYAIVALILDFNKDKNLLNSFISVRERFEEFLLEYDYLINQIVRNKRNAIKSYPHVKKFYLSLIKQLKENKSKEQAISQILHEPEFHYLTLQNTDEDQKSDITKEFSQSVKSQVFMTEALSSSIRCKICGGFIHRNAISFDHKQRKSDGGLGTSDNAQLAHPYCNTTYKH